jgi:adenylate cyclase class 2
MTCDEPSLEIEAKFQVPSLDMVRERLHELHIFREGVEQQQDVYYAAPDRDFGGTDEALRLRYFDHRCILTYKGPKLTPYGLKAREEVNVAVESGKNMDRILRHLHYTPAYVIRKKREYYRWGEIEIALDEVSGLGTFVEIELKKQQNDPEAIIERIKKDLKIEGESTSLSYLELLSTGSSVQPEYPSPPH